MNTRPNNFFKASTVLVTGASGFIGTHLCRLLSQHGAHVTGCYLTHRPSGQHANWVSIDLTDQVAVHDLVQRLRPTHIFHLASSVYGSRELDAVGPTFENNLVSTVNLLTAAQQLGSCKRLVITNSLEEPERGDPQSVPSSPYAASKFAASGYARMFHALYGLPVVIARVFMVYGPEQKDQRKLVPYTILKALNGETPELSSGQRCIDWIYVGDVVEGLLHLGAQAGIDGETIDIGSGQIHRTQEVVIEILKQIDPQLRGHFGALADRPMEQERVANTGETKYKTGWKSQVGLTEGLSETIEWYRAQLDLLNRPSGSSDS